MTSEALLLKAKVLIQCAGEAAQAADTKRKQELGYFHGLSEAGKRLYEEIDALNLKSAEAALNKYKKATEAGGA